MRVVLLGDSHLSRVRRDLWRVTPEGGEVVNAAVGGAVAADLMEQAEHVRLGTTDRLILSVGTNDAAPWKQVPIDLVVSEVGRVAAAHDVRQWVYLAPPGVREERLTGDPDRTNEVVHRYGAAVAAVIIAAKGSVVDTPSLIAPLGPSAFTPDGVHLSGAGYEVVLPALVRALARIPRVHPRRPFVQ